MSPMRPAVSLPRLDTYPGAIPQGWLWQAKLNDERGMLSPEGMLVNRLRKPFAPHKVRAFGTALEMLVDLFPGEWVDLALLGFRGGFPAGSIVILDLPGRPGGFVDRIDIIQAPYFLPDLGEELPDSPGVLRLQTDWNAKELFLRTIGKTGLEGVIGRRPGVRYAEGDSRDMCKSKWRN